MLRISNLTRGRNRLIQSHLAGPVINTLKYSGAVRWYAAPERSKKEDAPSFKKIFLVAIVGTLVFIQTANSLDKNKPKTSYSEAEFENVMNGLKRRVAIFPAGTLDVKFVLSSDREALKKRKIDTEIVIEPKEVVDFYRTQKDGNYEALLTEVYEKYGAQAYIDKLPSGMLVMLIGKYMKEKCKPHDRVVILNFPHSIKDAIKFENEVSTVSKVFTPRSESDSEVYQYYDTVHKVERF